MNRNGRIELVSGAETATSRGARAWRIAAGDHPSGYGADGLKPATPRLRNRLSVRDAVHPYTAGRSNRFGGATVVPRTKTAAPGRAAVSGNQPIWLR